MSSAITNYGAFVKTFFFFHFESFEGIRKIVSFVELSLENWYLVPVVISWNFAVNLAPSIIIFIVYVTNSTDKYKLPVEKVWFQARRKSIIKLFLKMVPTYGESSTNKVLETWIYEWLTWKRIFLPQMNREFEPWLKPLRPLSKNSIFSKKKLMKRSFWFSNPKMELGTQIRLSKKYRDL